MSTDTGILRRPRTAAPTDMDLERAVRAEIEWAPEVDASTIGVSAHLGVVYLDGVVGTTVEEARARDAALRVHGVRGLVDALDVVPMRGVPDAALQDAAAHALRHAAGVPARVRATVRDGVVVLTGSAGWHAERETARRVVERLGGVRQVRDEIVLTARSAAPDTELRIRRALRRNAAVDADAITVRVDGTEVVLAGAARSERERRQAAEAAWSSPHVTEVRNRITIAA
jgi:osmotically-inducible protein OsmY